MTIFAAEAMGTVLLLMTASLFWASLGGDDT